jgi:ParB family chromosome partitioning protein
MIIKDEFKKLIPPLAIEEFNQLEKNIIADGCRDPLLTWNGILIDGHNRYEICTKHGLKFIVVEKDFVDSSAAKLWMIDNQNGRRNLTDGWKYQLSQAKKEILLGVGKESMSEGGKGLSIVDKPSHNTQKTIANDLGWSTGKVAMADKVWKEATPEVKEQVLSGDVSINEAYKAIKAGNTHVGKNSGENEWYTPEKFIEAARSVMGSIDIDPASSELANKTVKATVFFSKDDCGLNRDWSGNVWMNPPYAQPLMNDFAAKLVEQLPNINAAIVLVNNATETKWFQSMSQESAAICFPETRIKFVDVNGNLGAPLQGQAILYFGDDTQAFSNVFSKFGLVLTNG